MITKTELQIATANFRRAASEFGFDFIENPSFGEGITAFGHIPLYGGKNGTLICLTAPPDFITDKKIIEWCKSNDYFCSILNIKPLATDYDSSYFREMLQDWGKYK